MPLNEAVDVIVMDESSNTNHNSFSSSKTKGERALVKEEKSSTEVITKSFEVVQNISATNQFSISKLNESTITVPDIHPVSAIKQRRRNSNIRYATIGNFTLPSSLRDKSESVLSDPETRNRLSNLVDYWASDVDSSSYSINSCVESSNRNTNLTSSSSNQILPAKIVSQFKPILNVHKRALTAPVTLSLKKLPNSNSIDSFLAVNEDEKIDTEVISETKKSYRQEMKIKLKHSPIEETSVSGEMNGETEGTGKRNSIVDLSKSLPNHNKKKVTAS